jgi:hypothetical protein
VARKTIFAGFTPKSAEQAIHRIAVLAYDGVVLGDLATPLESSDVSVTKWGELVMTCGCAELLERCARSI